MRVTESLNQTQFLNSINLLESGINQTQNQMASNLSFTTASQNPTGAGSVNNYKQALAQGLGIALPTAVAQAAFGPQD